MFGFDLPVLFFGLIILVLYFVPAIVAHSRKHPKRTAIRILNILAGWTFIGWVGALVWAYSYDPKEAKAEKAHE